MHCFTPYKFRHSIWYNIMQEAIPVCLFSSYSVPSMWQHLEGMRALGIPP